MAAHGQHAIISTMNDNDHRPSTPPPDSPIERARRASITERIALSRLAAIDGQSPRKSHGPTQYYPPVPAPSQDRLDASLNEVPLDANTLTQSEVSAAEEKGKTVLYLAYGSNLCKETFRGKRGIRPISQINVQVPELKLTFDLPGIPYMEPCFSNSGLRDPDESYKKRINGAPVKPSDYHKDRWHKGLVGCVYEVTPSDYAHIIATEGGGSSYKDVLVTCYPLPDVDTVPTSPTTSPFKAHTLFAPASRSESRCAGSYAERLGRPDPSYAQPSARYMKLLTDGAAELKLPSEYREYLAQIRTYTMTSWKQKVGKASFLAVWVPFLLLMLGLQKVFHDEKGRNPKWLTILSGALFAGMWGSYDIAFKKVFGDGERTEGLDDEGSGRRRRAKSQNGYLIA